MKTIKIISVIFSIIALFAAYSKDATIKGEREELVLSGTIGVAEEVTPFTRATQNVFEANTDLRVIVRDNVSKFLVPGDKTTRATTKTGSDGKNELACVPILFWDDLGGRDANLSLYGIFPYVGTAPIAPIGNIVTWDIKADQSTYPIEQELMFAQEDQDATGYTYADKGTPAHLNFEHVLSKITITIEVNEIEGFDAATLDGATVTFKEIPLKADYDITDNSCDAKYGKTGTVIPAKSTNKDSAEPPNTISYSYTILCAPHEYEKNALLAEIAVKGNTYKIVVPENLEFKRGEHTSVTVKLRGSDVTVTASLTDWVDSEVKPEIENQIITFQDFVINDLDEEVLTEGSTIHMTFTDDASKVHNAIFTYNDSKWEATTPVYWDDITTAISRVEALLTIYQATNGEHYFTGKLEDADFTKANAIENGSRINLDKSGKFFSHPLSKVEIIIKTSTGTDKINIDNIKSGSVIIKGKVNYVVGTTAITQNTTDGDLNITNASNTDTDKHQCITAYIWPQDLIELCQVTVDDNTYYVQANNGSDYTFEPGKHYTFTVKITKTGISTTASLIDWDPVVIDDIETQL